MIEHSGGAAAKVDAAEVSPPAPSGGRRAAAFVLGLFAPGCGQFLLGRTRRAAAWFGATLALRAVVIVLTLAAWPAAFLAALVALASLRLVSSLETFWLRPGARMRSGSVATVGLLVVVTALLLLGAVERALLVEAFKIPAASMWPTLQVGDRFYADKTSRRPDRGNIVVFTYPVEHDKTFVKRVIGLEGDRLDLRDGVLLLNGEPVARSRVNAPCQPPSPPSSPFEPPERPIPCELWEETMPGGRRYQVANPVVAERSAYPYLPITVPKGFVFVLGDNRGNSHDSRFWGPVPHDHIKGRALFLWWSSNEQGLQFDRMGRPVR